MSARRLLSMVARSLGLVLAYGVLFVVGSRLLWRMPASPASTSPDTSAAQSAALLSLLAIAVIDTAILAAIAAGSRLRGRRLWALLSGFFYFVKTLTSMLEAAYFMRNVTPAMLPGMFTMTVPLCVLFPPLLMAALGLWKSDPRLAPVWRPPRMTRRALAGRIALLAVVVYPVLFFVAGYFIAWQSPVLREFYSGSTRLDGVLEHFRATLAADPGVYPFEVMRGLLWVGAAAAVLFTSRGPAWRSVVLVALAFALIQNDVHLLDNPLMPAEVRHYHFVETASSNAVWAAAIGWLLARPRRRAGAAPLAEERVGLG